jgi:aldehyde:ferredoxin oxidoreductase
MAAVFPSAQWLKLLEDKLNNDVHYPCLMKELDPFSPEAPLLFLNGPLTGTSGPTVGRFVVCGKSRATGLWAESNCGGF